MWVVVWPIVEKWRDGAVEEEEIDNPVVLPLSAVGLIERYEIREEADKAATLEYNITPAGSYSEDSVLRCWRFLLVGDIWRAFDAAGWKGAGQPQGGKQ